MPRLLGGSFAKIVSWKHVPRLLSVIIAKIKVKVVRWDHALRFFIGMGRQDVKCDYLPEWLDGTICQDC
jgi:hypothetical protein